MLKSPFPYFGGKSRVAAEVWRRFGDVKNYVEPFCGSAAVLLARPTEPRIETINDLDGYVANFWRATKYAPEQVAAWADWPINEADLHSRHRWLMEQDIQRVKDDPHYYDPKIAGWWVWGQSAWLGSGWCKWPAAEQRPNLLQGQCGVHRKRPCVGKGEGVHRKRPHLVHGERGVHSVHKLPHVASGGRGVHRQIPILVKGGGSGVHRTFQQVPSMNSGCGIHRGRCDLYAYFQALADRLRRVRVCCGHWSRVCTHCVTDYQGLTAVFLDPPYGKKAGRDSDLYATDSLTVAEEVREWAVEHGNNEKLRIALCGYEGEHDMPGNWSVYSWESVGGYGKPRKNRRRERIWFSPHCLSGENMASAGRTIFPPPSDVAGTETVGAEVSGSEVGAANGVDGVVCSATEHKEDNEMATKMTEKDLAKCGLMVDPQNPAQIVPIDREAVPDDTWDLDRLAQYAATGLTEAGRLRTEALLLARRSTVQTFRAGRALAIAQEKLKADRGWVQWLKAHNIPRTSAWEAVELFKRAGSEEALADLTLTQAKNKFHITGSPKRRPAGAINGATVLRERQAVEAAPQVLSFPAAQTHDQASSEANGAGDVTAPAPGANEDGSGPSLLSFPTQGGEHGQSGNGYYDHEQWDAPSPDEALAVLVALVDRLEFLERDAARIEWTERPKAEFARLVERGTQVFKRLRERVVAA